jgi:sugar-specific transcriptional regulator TrmB
MKHIKGFDKLGLSTRDSRVYSELLKQGVSSIRSISDATAINRGSTYESIKNLMNAGLVNYQVTKKNKKYFAQPPSKVFELINQRRAELDELELEARRLTPELLSGSAYLPYANIKFFEDPEGIAVILRDLLNTVEQLEKKEYLAISSKPMRKYLYEKFPHFTRERLKRKIFVRVVAVGEGGDPLKQASRKWLNVEAHSQPDSYTLIYGDKFAMITLNEDLHPYGIVVEDKGITDMQKIAFEQLWNSIPDDITE